MAKKKKKRGPSSSDPENDEDAPVVLPKAPEKLVQAFGGLKDFKLPKSAKKSAPAATKAKPVPANQPPPKRGEPGYSYADRVALRNAYAGVVPARPGKSRPRAVPATPPDPDVILKERAAEDAARGKLAQLVAGGLRFDVVRDADGFVEGVRTGVGPAPLRELKSGRAMPDSEIDLHRMRAQEASIALVRFLRTRRRERDRVVLVVHGKGVHSEGGIAVLADHVLSLMTEGEAAPHVLAFTTADAARGGTGALLVRLAP